MISAASIDGYLAKNNFAERPFEVALLLLMVGSYFAAVNTGCPAEDCFVEVQIGEAWRARSVSEVGFLDHN